MRIQYLPSRCNASMAIVPSNPMPPKRVDEKYALSVVQDTPDATGLRRKRKYAEWSAGNSRKWPEAGGSLRDSVGVRAGLHHY